MEEHEDLQRYVIISSLRLKRLRERRSSTNKPSNPYLELEILGRQVSTRSKNTTTNCAKGGRKISILSWSSFVAFAAVLSVLSANNFLGWSFLCRGYGIYSRILPMAPTKFFRYICSATAADIPATFRSQHNSPGEWRR